jgi:adenylate kinase
MRIIMLGAPGAGKGTISKLLVEKYSIIQISTGDMLRQAITLKTKVAQKAEAYIVQGNLVPDEIILEIMKERLQREDCAEGFILDGFPRTIVQAEALHTLLGDLSLTLDAVINIDVPEQVIIERISNRRTCQNSECQAIYNVVSQPPKVEGVCDNCGSPIMQREDETIEAVKHRLVTYTEKTYPLVEFYRKEGLLKSVNGNQDPWKVYDEVVAALKP